MIMMMNMKTVFSAFPQRNKTMYYDRFDIVSAHYAFYSDWHCGQHSAFYKRLCRILSKLKFSPGAAWKGYDSLSDNGKDIYNNLQDDSELIGRLIQRGF